MWEGTPEPTLGTLLTTMRYQFDVTNGEAELAG